MSSQFCHIRGFFLLPRQMRSILHIYTYIYCIYIYMCCKENIFSNVLEIFCIYCAWQVFLGNKHFYERANILTKYLHLLLFFNTEIYIENHPAICQFFFSFSYFDFFFKLWFFLLSTLIFSNDRVSIQTKFLHLPKYFYCCDDQTGKNYISCPPDWCFLA